MLTGYGLDSFGIELYGGDGSFSEEPGPVPNSEELAILNSRSVFTDKGPISKTPLILLQGSSLTFVSFNTVEISTVTFSTALVGKFFGVTGSGKNDGSYLIVEVPAPNRLRVNAQFSIPDNLSGTWQVFDPRTGQIADDPSHVRVKVDGVVVIPEAVQGLLGQIILPLEPPSGSVVQVSYDWIPNPTVEITRLNSREFKFNNWNRDTGRAHGGTGHIYRYNNVLLRPSQYRPSKTVQQGTIVTVLAGNQVTLAVTPSNPVTPLDTWVGLTLGLTGLLGTTYHRVEGVTASILQVSGSVVGPYTKWVLLDQNNVLAATLQQPQSRQLHYRAYERAYSALFNDPNLLVFNTPQKRIAYPPLQRIIYPQVVSYTPTTTPENDPGAPWEKVGTGTVTIESNRLRVQGSSAGVFPAGSPLFWRKPLDLSYPHTFALAWNMTVNTVQTYQGIWTGLAVGYSTDTRAILVGLIEVQGVKKVGFLRSGYLPEDPAGWVGGFDLAGNATYMAVPLDWNIQHSYRLFRGTDGVIHLYLDGAVTSTLRISEADLPFLEDVGSPFNALQQVFWGSLGRSAQTDSLWDFVRLQSTPSSPVQTAPSVFVSYEGNDHPEEAYPPWTPVGSQGYETILDSEYLLISSTSATDATTEGQVGLVGGDFRGLVRTEPLLSMATDVTLDVWVRGYTYTQGTSANAVMAAIDDGSYLTQLSFVTDKAAPILGYGGRSLPTHWSPTPWTANGTATVSMRGNILRIEDSQTDNGLVYAVYDESLPGSDTRVLDAGSSYMVEFRCQVTSYTADLSGFCGATVDVYDGFRTFGVLLRVSGSTRQVAFHSDGVVKAVAAFEWGDAAPHTYRVTKVGGDLTLFVDQTVLLTVPYSLMDQPSAGSVGSLSFGSATASSVGATSTVDWHYVNSWRVWPDQKFFVGLWRGTSGSGLLDYHLPCKAQYRDLYIQVNGNLVTLPVPLAASVTVGDLLLVDGGANRNTYQIESIGLDRLTFTVDQPFPLQPATLESFRVVQSLDWRVPHAYRVSRTPSNNISVFLDDESAPFLTIGYNDVDLPRSEKGIVRVLSGGLPSICWGAFDPANLSMTSWDFVRYGVTRAPNELRLVPPHQVMNQRNVIASPEHLRTSIAHSHTDFWSSSTGIPPQTEPDLFRNPAQSAYTVLNEDTPLVPRTQTSEVRVPTPYRHFVSAFNRVEDVMNVDGDFTFNDGTFVFRLLVPDDVLYNSLEVIERTEGTPNKIAPFDDEANPRDLALSWQKKICLSYDGSTVPEEAPNQPTPWVLASDDPSHVNVVDVYTHLNYGTDSVGTRTLYRNNTPLTDSPSLTTRVTFRVRVEQDGTYGLGDTQIRLGFSAIGMTLALAFKTMPSGDRYIFVVDLNAQTILAGIPFDYLDGEYHTYQLVRNPAHNSLTVRVVN